MPEIRDLMPKADEEGWHQIDVGPRIDMRFHPDRQLGGNREPDNIRRQTIEVAIAGRLEQSLRFDPFSEGAHWHIRPAKGRGQIQLVVPEGADPLEVVLAWFGDQRGFCHMLEAAERGDEEIADFNSLVTAGDLARAAGQIRTLSMAVPA